LRLFGKSMRYFLSTTGALPFSPLTSIMEGSMQQPSLFPEHHDAQPEPVFTERQRVALIAVMSQIVKAFFERARQGEPGDDSP
jgi:hypothetical protein